MNYTVQPPLQAEDAVLLCSYRLLTIFKSCGSSSILYFLINLPTFVILGSPLILNTGPSISLYFIKSSCRFSAFYTYCGIYTSQNEYYSSPPCLLIKRRSAVTSYRQCRYQKSRERTIRATTEQITSRIL